MTRTQNKAEEKKKRKKKLKCAALEAWDVIDECCPTKVGMG